MTPFQIFLLSVLSLVGAVVAALTLRGTVGRLAGGAWLVVIGAGIVFALHPDWTTDIAHLLGISRGTDLLLYLLVLAVLQGFLLIYLKLRRVRRELTLLVRELAIRDAERRAPGAAPDDGAAERR